MRKQRVAFVVALCFCICIGVSARNKYEVVSPDGKLKVSVVADKTVSYTVVHEADTLLYASPISMETDTYTFGKGSHVKSTARRSVNEVIKASFYRKDSIPDCYNELLIRFRQPFNLVFRVYNEGMAYRFVSTGTAPFIVKSEEATFNQGGNRRAYIPYVRKNGSFEDQFFNTFENTYEYTPINEWKAGKLAFLPLLVEAGNGKKICISEADLESYPGMYLINTERNSVLKSVFAPYPKRTAQGSHDKSTTVGGHNQVVLEREPFIARCRGGQAFPWRVVAVSTEDKALVDNDMVYKLAEPSRLKDVSWIKPGQVAWEWWNDRNLSGVNFKTGINNETYKYYIDFASRNNIRYVVLDDGWYDRVAASAFAVAPTLNLEELIRYAEKRGVGLMLWMGYYVFDKDMEKAMKHYADMGIKGFKLDAIGRDDQLTNEFYYRSAKLAAEHRLIIDFHGGAKPAGINRTYPNVLNVEGVHGLEQVKNKGYDCDMVTYDVTFPFIRMVAGAVDYTQGAMRNATKADYRAVWSEPMSQGTRCRQLAEYIVFDSPLNMLCDSPTNYMREQECTSFITSVPTVWDNSVSLNGEIGKYLSVARKHGKHWYVGSLTNWDARSLELDLSFLGKGTFKAEVFKDGINADRVASDYVKEIIDIPADRKLRIEMASGGGYAMKIVNCLDSVSADMYMPSAPTKHYDVVIVGGTPGGIMTAIAAAREGKTALILERTSHIGGLPANGLGATDISTRNATTGLFREFVKRNRQHYVDTYGENSQQVKDCSDGYHFEPSVAEQTFLDMIREQGNRITVLYNRQFDSDPQNLQRLGRVIEAVKMLNRKTQQTEVYTGKVFVDATYEGDLAAAANVPFRVGRESRSEFGEVCAGKIYRQWGVQLGKGVKSYFNGYEGYESEGTTYQGDNAVQAYNYRLCLTRDKRQLKPIARPERYNRSEYVSLIDDVRTGRNTSVEPLPPGVLAGIARITNMVKLPNEKTDANNQHFAFISTDLPEENWLWPTAGWEWRDRYAERLKNYTLGLLWFAQNDKELPPHFREACKEWGLSTTEYADNDHFPRQVYVREGRRFEGLYFFTANDALPVSLGQRPPIHRHSITASHYALDSHAVLKREEGRVHLDGFFGYESMPYTIPFGVMASGDVDNLLFPVPVSGSHVGFSTLRMEPCWMALGEAAGIAAAQIIEQGMPARELNVATIQQKLIAHKATLMYFKDVSIDSPHFNMVQQMGISGYLPEWNASLEDTADKETLKSWARMSGMNIPANVTKRKEVLYLIYNNMNQTK